MKALKRLLWFPIVYIIMISWMAFAFPMLLILGRKDFDKKFTDRLMKFCYNKIK